MTITTTTTKTVGEWVCTDADSMQHQFAISDAVFKMTEIIPCPDGGYIVAYSEIDLNNFTAAQIEEYVSGYYDSTEALMSIYGKDSQGVIAECIFECLQLDEYRYLWPAKTREKAESLIARIISRNS